MGADIKGISVVGTDELYQLKFCQLVDLVLIIMALLFLNKKKTLIIGTETKNTDYTYRAHVKKTLKEFRKKNCIG